MAIPEFRYAGPPNFLQMPFAGTYAINTGDLCYWDGTSIWPFSHLAAGGSEAADQLSVAPVFVGMSKNTLTVLDTTAEAFFPVVIDCVVEMDCVSQTWSYGDLVGPTRNSLSTLQSQMVTKVTAPNLAIGKVLRPYATATTRVQFEMKSAVLGPMFNGNGFLAFSTTGTVTGFTAGSSTASKVDSTFTGNSGTTAYTVGDLVLMLKNNGFLAQ